jgi:hypothetical protein
MDRLGQSASPEWVLITHPTTVPADPLAWGPGGGTSGHRVSRVAVWCCIVLPPLLVGLYLISLAPYSAGLM